MICVSDNGCPFDRDDFIQEVEHYLLDPPFMMNPTRIAARCDLSISLKGFDVMVERWLDDRRVNKSLCDALTTVYGRYVTRLCETNPKKSSGTLANNRR